MVVAFDGRDYHHVRLELFAIVVRWRMPWIGDKSNSAAVRRIGDMSDQWRRHFVELHPEAMQVNLDQGRVVLVGRRGNQLHIPGPKEGLVVPRILETANRAADHRIPLFRTLTLSDTTRINGRYQQ